MQHHFDNGTVISRESFTPPRFSGFYTCDPSVTPPQEAHEQSNTMENANNVISTITDQQGFQLDQQAPEFIPSYDSLDSIQQQQQQQEEQSPHNNYAAIGVSGVQLLYWSQLEQTLRDWCPEVAQFIEQCLMSQQQQANTTEFTNNILFQQQQQYHYNNNNTTDSNVSEQSVMNLPEIPHLSHDQIVTMNRIYNNAFVATTNFNAMLGLPADYMGYSALQQNNACIVHRIELYQEMNNNAPNSQGTVYFYLDKDPTTECLPKDLIFNFSLLAHALQWFAQQSAYFAVPHLRVYSLHNAVSALNRQSQLLLQPLEITCNAEYLQHLTAWSTFQYRCHLTRIQHVECLFCHVSYLSITAHACGHGGGTGYPATEDNVPMPMRTVLYEAPAYPELAPPPHPFTLGVHYRFETIVRAIQMKCFPRRNRQPVFQQYAQMMRQLWTRTLQRFPQLHQQPLGLLFQFEEQILEFQWNIMLSRHLPLALQPDILVNNNTNQQQQHSTNNNNNNNTTNNDNNNDISTEANAQVDSILGNAATTPESSSNHNVVPSSGPNRPPLINRRSRNTRRNRKSSGVTEQPPAITNFDSFPPLSRACRSNVMKK